ncbi:hypothetical protein ACHWQZ_G001877 [Mnemiopsis leidyi]
MLPRGRNLAIRRRTLRQKSKIENDHIDLETSKSLELFIAEVEAFESLGNEKKDHLRELDLLVLDTSIRETTVGSIRGHTLDNKREIFKEIKKCGFKYYVIEAFNTETRVGDVFVKSLNDAGEDLSGAFAFSECWDVVKNKIPQEEPIPVGMRKCLQFGVPNVIIEVDLCFYKVDYGRFDEGKICELLKKRLQWIKKNLSKDSLTFVNLRDFSDAMASYPQRVWKVVNFLSSLPAGDRILGIMIEDLGKYDKDHLGGWTKALRSEMKRCGWEDGHLLVHVHEQWGLVQGNVLEMLAMGGTGIWAGICSEGAALGHADSCTTILNLIRLGNTKVLNNGINCQYLREAAINVTKIVTTEKPFERQPVYGERATDMVFGFVFDQINNSEIETDSASLSGGRIPDFDLSKFLGVKSELRITTMASPEMILLKLRSEFGDEPQFTIDIAGAMKDQIIKNLTAGRKEEYTSKSGLAMLFDQSGGHVTAKIAEIINATAENKPHIDFLIEEVKKLWKMYDEADGTADDTLTFENFYNGFMAPYFGCYRCEDSQAGLRVIDLDYDGCIEWTEFRYFLIWAGREYPSVKNMKELLDKTFRNGIIPAMLDELSKME